MREHHTKPSKIRITRFSLYFSEFIIQSHRSLQFYFSKRFITYSLPFQIITKNTFSTEFNSKNKLKRKTSIRILFRSVQVFHLPWAEHELQLWSIFLVWQCLTPSCQPTGWVKSSHYHAVHVKMHADCVIHCFWIEVILKISLKRQKDTSIYKGDKSL